MLSRLIKQGFNLVGLDVQRRDRLLELIPNSYEMSPFLPRIYDASVKRVLYFSEMVERITDIEGDIVECGTSIGHGLLYLVLLCEMDGGDRQFYAFDSFEGFPAPTGEDVGTHAFKGYYKTPPEIVQRVLKDGRVSEAAIRERIHLVRGFFEDTITDYDGTIALLHLDCDLYDSYKVCLEQLYDRVAPGGVILFDDYRHIDFPGAAQAVDEFFEDKPNKPEKHKCGKYFVQKAHSAEASRP